MISCSSQKKAISSASHVVIAKVKLRRYTITKDNRLQLTPEQVKDLVLQSLDDNKGIDIVSIPLDGKSLIADFMVIASGSSSLIGVSLFSSGSSVLFPCSVFSLFIYFQSQDDDCWVMVCERILAVKSTTGITVW